MSIVNTGTVYFRIVALSYIPMAVSNILSSWLRCKEYATIPFLASFGAVIVNTGLNYLLIFGKFGFPCMAIKELRLPHLFRSCLILYLLLSDLSYASKKMEINLYCLYILKNHNQGLSDNDYADSDQ